MSTFTVQARRVEILPHPDADMIELARVDGYVSIVRREEYQTGELAVYIPEQAIVPLEILTDLGLLKRDRETGEVETLEDGTPVGGLAGREGNRVKAIRLRGVLSQGLLYRPRIPASSCDGDLIVEPALEPSELETLGKIDFTSLDEGKTVIFLGDRGEDGRALAAFRAAFPGHELIESLVEGRDYAETLGITKWVPPVPIDMAGKAYACSRITTYTDIENAKRFPGVLADGEEVVATEKAHGTCTVLFLDVDGSFHVSSKGMAKQHLALEDERDEQGRPRNAYWRSALQHEIPEKLRLIRDELVGASSDGDTTVSLYGETLGVQDLRYGLVKGQLSFHAFDLAMDGRYLDYDRFTELMDRYGIPTVPVLYRGPFSDEAIWEVASGKEQITGTEQHIREGAVVRPTVERQDMILGGRVVLKFVSDAYLLRKGEATEFE